MTSLFYNPNKRLPNRDGRMDRLVFISAVVSGSDASRKRRARSDAMPPREDRKLNKTRTYNTHAWIRLLPRGKGLLFACLASETGPLSPKRSVRFCSVRCDTHNLCVVVVEWVANGNGLRLRVLLNVLYYYP
jgi:hypothetical protein